VSGYQVDCPEWIFSAQGIVFTQLNPIEKIAASYERGASMEAIGNDRENSSLKLLADFFRQVGDLFEINLHIVR
jgi:hypothetical protein